jgi:hypothetical protein
MLSSSPSTGALLILLDTCTVSSAAFRWENRTALAVEAHLLPRGLSPRSPPLGAVRRSAEGGIEDQSQGENMMLVCSGTYAQDGDQLMAEVTTEAYTTVPGMVSVFGVDRVHMHRRRLTKREQSYVKRSVASSADPSLPAGHLKYDPYLGYNAERFLSAQSRWETLLAVPQPRSNTVRDPVQWAG